MTSVTLFEDLLQALADAGLWEHVSADTQGVLIDTLRSGEDAAWVSGGAWRADGEDLADGGVETWLGKMAAPLLDCNVELRVASIVGPFDEGSTGYSLAVNDELLRLYEFAKGEPGVPAIPDPWMDCTLAPAGCVNRLLAAAGSNRRVAVFWPGGNDGVSVLGEERVLRRALASGSASGSWDGLIPG